MSAEIMASADDADSNEHKIVNSLFAIMAFCAVVPLYFEDTRQVLGLIFVSIMTYLFLSKKKPKDFYFQKHEKIWLAIAVSYASVFIVSFLLRTPYTDDGSWRIAAPFFILLLSAWYFLVLRYDMRSKAVIYIAVSSIVVAIFLFIFEIYLVNDFSHYIYSSLKSDIGAVAFILPITTVLLMVVWLKERKPLYLLLSFIGFVLSGLVESRTALMILIIPSVLLVFSLLFRGRSFKLNHKTFTLLAATFLAVLMAWLAQDKIKSTFDDFNKMSNQDFYSSMGLRFAMLDVGWGVAKDNVVLGVGPSQYKSSLKQELNKVEYSPQVETAIVGFTQIHNQYLMDLMLNGLAGVLSLLAFVFYPLVLFYGSLKKERNLASLGATGLMFGIGFILFFGAIFTYTYTTIFYMLSISSLISYIKLNEEGKL